MWAVLNANTSVCMYVCICTRTHTRTHADGEGRIIYVRGTHTQLRDHEEVSLTNIPPACFSIKF